MENLGPMGEGDWPLRLHPHHCRWLYSPLTQIGEFQQGFSSCQEAVSARIRSRGLLALLTPDNDLPALHVAYRLTAKFSFRSISTCTSLPYPCSPRKRQSPSSTLDIIRHPAVLLGAATENGVLHVWEPALANCAIFDPFCPLTGP